MSKYRRGRTVCIGSDVWDCAPDDGPILMFLDSRPDGLLVASGCGLAGVIDGRGENPPQWFVIDKSMPVCHASFGVRPDTLLVFTHDGRMIIWDCVADAAVKTERLPVNFLTSADHDPRHAIAVVGGTKGDVVVLKTDRWRVKRLPLHSYLVTAVALSPDGKQIASACLARDLKVTSLKSGKCLYKFRFAHQVLCCAFYGDKVVAGFDNGSAAIVSGDTAIIKQINKHAAIASVDVDADTGRILFASPPGVKIYDGQTLQPLHSIKMTSVRAARFVPGCDKIAVISCVRQTSVLICDSAGILKCYSVPEHKPEGALVSNK